MRGASTFLPPGYYEAAELTQIVQMCPLSKLCGDCSVNEVVEASVLSCVAVASTASSMLFMSLTSRHSKCRPILSAQSDLNAKPGLRNAYLHVSYVATCLTALADVVNLAIVKINACGVRIDTAIAGFRQQCRAPSCTACVRTAPAMQSC
jgi:hypothetical protein